MNEWYVDRSQEQLFLVVSMDCHLSQRTEKDEYIDVFHQTIDKRVPIDSLQVKGLQDGLSIILHQVFEEFLLLWGVL